MNAAVGLLALWTGQLSANVSHMQAMAIHQMDDKELDQFSEYVSQVTYSIASIAKYVTECQETK